MDNPYEMLYEEPPPGQRGLHSRGKFTPWLDAMRAEPGVWFKFPEPVKASAYQSCYNHRKVNGKQVYEPRFRVDKSLPTEDDQHVGWLYCRYVGEPD